MKTFEYSVIAVVAVAILAGFFIVGSPQEERLRRFDEQRVSDLQDIQWQIVNYWQSKRKLPAALADLTDTISGFRAPLDPETQTPYEYVVRGDLQFTLCADFASESRDGSSEIQPIAKGIEDNWPHGPGRACFDRSIDPDLYKPFPKDVPAVRPLP